MKAWILATLTAFGLIFAGLSLLVGGCKLFYHKRSTPVRELCDKYPVGSEFKPSAFAKDVLDFNIQIGGIENDRVRINLRNQTAEDKAELAKLNDQFSGRATGTMPVGIPLFTCELMIKKGRIETNRVYQWD